MQQVDYARAQSVMGTAEDRYTYRVNVFLNGSRGDHLGCLPEACIDDLHTCITQSTSYHLCTPVMSVKAGLCHQDPYLSFTHSGVSILTSDAGEQTAGFDIRL